MQTIQRKWKYWARLLLVSLIWGGALYLLGYLWLYIRVETHPIQGKLCCKTPSDFGFDYLEARFRVSPDTQPGGITLAGWYIPSQNGAAVILLHGSGGSRMGMLPYAAMLAKHGFGVLLYDQRACGESQGTMRSYGWLDAGDLLEAVKYVQAQPDVDPESIGVLGTSLGGQIAIRAAAQSAAIRAVVSDGTSTAVAADIPPTATLKEWLYGLMNPLVDGIQWVQTGVKPPRGVMESIPEIAPRPLLLIAAGQHPQFPGIELRYGHALYEAAGEPKTLWEIPEASHCGGLATRPQEYEQKVVAFFIEALLK